MEKMNGDLAHRWATLILASHVLISGRTRRAGRDRGTQHFQDRRTGTVPAPEKLLFGMMSRLASACAARFQWKTVGRLLPENAAYTTTSYQLTPATGCFSIPFGKLPSSQVDGPGRPVPSRKTAIASCHGTARPLLRNGSFQSSCFS